MPLFEDELVVNCPIDRVFDFLLRPANVVRISDPSMGLRFLNAPEIVELGSRLTFQMMGMGQVQECEHHIVSITPPQLIVEEQTKGIMRKWRHEHIFECQGDGTTRVIDRIEFEPPGGIVGFIVTEKKILGALEDGFFHRHQQLKRILEAECRS
ncbi:SRPBCC family protein [Planctomyces sp. SH-PL14]|uniref:SRPBCC family protein n=1 Tax=Planctomyces sp. SH-PL14 TaxID=1632864 RepID=UPI00078CB6C7|nr:hypothetical protein [Planctomyces sp. SH-PL14]AMV22197.1 hypothetical protein VT03_30110 [Planctomyces sp. SH-PL14]